MAAFERPPVFVFGVTRSGTTLLARMLDLHPALSIYIESHYLHAVAGLPDAPLASDAAVRAVLRRVRDLDREGVKQTAVLDRFRHGDRSPRALFEAVLRCRMETGGKRRFGEKTPSHFLYLERLLGWYPDARLVFLRRDPRSIHASYKSSRDYFRDAWLDRSVLGRSLYWNHYRDVLRRARRRAPGQVWEVRFEALIAEPERVLRDLCAFLGEPFDARMLSVAVNNSSFRDTRPLPGLRSEPADRRHLLGRFETTCIELLSGEGMLEEGRRLERVPAGLVRGLSSLGLYSAAGRVHPAVRRLRRRS